MRFLLSLLLASMLLSNAALATACHGVGDVHVICKDGATSVIYIDPPISDTQTGQAGNMLLGDTCCPLMAANHMMPARFTWEQQDENSQQEPQQNQNPYPRHDSAAAPRGPPLINSF